MKIEWHPAILAALLAVGTPLPASAQLSPASPGDIAGAVSDCMAAVTGNDVDEVSLMNEGWSKGTVSSGGKAVETELEFYGKSGNNAAILTNGDDGSAAAVCIVMAKINQPLEYQSVVDAIDALEGVAAIKQDKLQIWFSSGDRFIQSDLTGTPAEPSVRIGVTTMVTEK